MKTNTNNKHGWRTTGPGLSLALSIKAARYPSLLIAKALILSFGGCGAAIVTFFLGSLLLG